MEDVRGSQTPHGAAPGGGPEPRLTSVGHQIEAHWRRWRPKMAAALEAQGKLRRAVYAAQELTGRTLVDLVSRGISYPEAWNLVCGRWAFLPDEETMPDLPFDPASLEPPARGEPAGG